jgi:hypothetical protein
MCTRFTVRSIVKAWLTASFIIIMGLPLVMPGALAADSPIPWAFGGYDGIENIHLLYWSASKDTIENVEKIIVPGFQTELNELWYSKATQSFRVDKYEEMGALRFKCNEFKGQPWETREHDDRTYFLSERVIQRGTIRTTYRLENILQSSDGREVCEYKQYTATKTAPTSVISVLPHLTMTPYTATPDSEEIALMGLEMDKMLNPDAYKQTLKELKNTYDIAGRKTAKWSTAHGTRNYLASGFIYVDLQWGIALEGHLTETQQTGQKAIKIENPVCIYRVISLDTKTPDAALFSVWQKQ